jgi:hypothetical protein
MLAGLGSALYSLHALLFGALAVFHVWVWVRGGFRIPKYVHVMALSAALIGWGLLEISPEDAPVRKQGLIQAASLVLIFPALVYGAFVLLGGALADERGDS